MRTVAKILIVSIVVGTLLIGTTLILFFGTIPTNNPPDDNDDTPEIPLEPPAGLSYKGVDIIWLVVAGVKLKYNDIVIFIDPFDIDGRNESIFEAADYIIITHNHQPHCSPRDIRFVSDENTTLITAREPSFVPGVFEDEVVLPGENLTYGDITFEFFPSYNIDKYNSEGVLFHPPSANNIGVVMDFNGTRIYHSGDTDAISEMQNISADIALLPVSGYAWMTADEAAIAVDYLQESHNLTYAIPIHWGYNEGSRFDAERFQDRADCDVIILDMLFSKYS
ncbi:MAG: MBL fold metallo-hydrolase [Candidatus Thorarchaeota archaeon]